MTVFKFLCVKEDEWRGKKKFFLGEGMTFIYFYNKINMVEKLQAFKVCVLTRAKRRSRNCRKNVDNLFFVTE